MVPFPRIFCSVAARFLLALYSGLREEGVEGVEGMEGVEGVAGAEGVEGKEGVEGGGMGVLPED